MKKHPDFAYEMLAPIHYLKAALDIRTAIMRSGTARATRAVCKANRSPWRHASLPWVDVWDALISDRPYRKAWTKDKVLEHMKAESGKHFDPQVLDAFLGMKEVCE